MSVATAYEAVTAMTDTDVKSHKIEFPVDDYPIKVIGDTVVGFKDTVIEILAKYATLDIKSLPSVRAATASTPRYNCTSPPPAKTNCVISIVPCVLPVSSTWCCDAANAGLS